MPVLLAAVGRELWLATAVGSPAPFVKELGDRMRHPRPGDLVLEVTRWDLSTRTASAG